MTLELILIGRGSAIALILATSLSAVPLCARPAGEAPAALELGYSGSDLGSSAGRARLRSRIAWAATSICLEDDRASPAPQQVDQACLRSVMSNALAQLDHAIAERAHPARTLAANAR